MDKIWQSTIISRKNNSPLFQRITTCSSMIRTCLDSQSGEKEKASLIKLLVRASSEISNFRKTADIISADALEFVNIHGKVIKNGNIHVSSSLKKELRHEHLVPCSFIVKQILSSNMAEENIANTLLALGIRCIITLDEDKRLNDIKLSSAMPNGWTINGNPFERYKQASIHNLSLKEAHIIP